MYVYNSQTYSTKLVDMCVLRFGSVRHLSIKFMIYEMREDLMFMLLNLRVFSSKMNYDMIVLVIKSVLLMFVVTKNE